MKSIRLLMIAIAAISSIASFSQDKAGKKDTTKHFTLVYSCPMHPEVTSDRAGKCSKCGMNLALSKKEQMKAEVVNGYYCPMHLDVTGDKPGKCSKCGMALVKKKN